MVTSLKDRQRKIECKYKRLIGNTIDKMNDSTMSELWVELNKLKAQMAADFDKAGIDFNES